MGDRQRASATPCDDRADGLGRTRRRLPDDATNDVATGKTPLRDLDDRSGFPSAMYDWKLKGKARPAFLAQRVAYFMLGADEWRHADDLKGAASAEVAFYLSSDGRADDVRHSGTLASELPSARRRDNYEVDPANPRLAEAELLVGQQVPLVNRPDAIPVPGGGLVYHSAPFENPMEISGGASLEMTVSMDAPDTDFWVGLFEVRADGQTVMITNTMLRARDQGGLKKPGVEVVYRLDDFWFFATTVKRGSRLRLVITPPLGSSWERNRQSGGVVNEETAADNTTAIVTLHHGPQTVLRLGQTRSKPK